MPDDQPVSFGRLLKQCGSKRDRFLAQFLSRNFQQTRVVCQARNRRHGQKMSGSGATALEFSYREIAEKQLALLLREYTFHNAKAGVSGAEHSLLSSARSASLREITIT